MSMKKILISAGPTVEKIDPVRFISNRSSGKMGYALAQAAVEAGFAVTLISGPVHLPEVPGVADFEKVESASEMAQAIKKYAEKMDIIIMAAAVADYRPQKVSTLKIKKSDTELTLVLERTEDILKYLGDHKIPGQILVGFAAETNDLEANAKHKLAKKNLDCIIANDVSKQNCGFEVNTNAVTIYQKDGSKQVLPLADKIDIARQIINMIKEIK